MNRILISSFLLGSGLMLTPLFVSAEVKFTEIMYDLPGTDTKREWVEIFNNGSETVTITSDFRFVTNGSNHTLTTKDNPLEIPANSYALIVDDPVRFSADWPGVSGLIIDSSFSLNNTAGDLVLKDGEENVLASVSYTNSQGGAGDTNSLQLNNNSWIAAQPTPLADNATEAYVPPSDDENNTGTTTDDQENDDNDSGGTGDSDSSGGGSFGGGSGGGGGSSTSGSTHSSHVADKNASVNYVFSVSAGRKRHTAAGSVVVFDAVPKLKSGEKNSRIDYRWSFGDGHMATGKRVSHTYSFPGDYIVVLNAKQGDEEAVSRTEVRVDKPEVVIRRIDRALGLIEIANNSRAEINLGSWRLRVGEKSFIFPTDTILKSEGEMVLPSNLTGFLPADLFGVVFFLAQDGQIVAQSMAVLALVNPATELPEIPTDSVEAEVVEQIEEETPVNVIPEEFINGPTGEVINVATTLPAALPIIIEKEPGTFTKMTGSIKKIFREVFR